MSVKATTVTAGEVISATQKFNNFSDEQSEFLINADVNISGKNVSGFNTGEVKKKGSENGMNVANFNASGNGITYLNIGFNGVQKEEAQSILSEIFSFMDNVEAIVKGEEE